MQNRFLPLLAVIAIALPAAAQAESPKHGIKAGNIVATYTAEVLPGQDAAFKEMLPRLLASVEQEPGMLMYEWSMRADGKTFDVVEIYQDSNAIVAHLKNAGTNFGADLTKTQKAIKFVIYGNPDAEAKKAIAPLHPEYETPIGGFIR